MCGGMDPKSGKSCLKLANGNWIRSHDLGVQRKNHVSWTRPDGKILLIGGDGSYGRTSTAIVDPQDPGDAKPSFDLPHDN